MDNIREVVPPWSLAYIGASITLAGVTTLKLISPYKFLLFFEDLFRGQIWRLFTSYFFAGKFSIGFFTHVLFTVMFLPQLERRYLKKRAELTMMIFFVVVVTLIFSIIPQYHYVMTAQFLQALIYIACRQSSGTYLIWGIPVQAQYVPFVHLLMDLFMGQSIIPDIIGLLAGHCYYFLKIVCPKTYGKDYLPTPRFL